MGDYEHSDVLGQLRSEGLLNHSVSFVIYMEREPLMIGDHLDYDDTVPMDEVAD